MPLERPYTSPLSFIGSTFASYKEYTKTVEFSLKKQLRLEHFDNLLDVISAHGAQVEPFAAILKEPVKLILRHYFHKSRTMHIDT